MKDYSEYLTEKEFSCDVVGCPMKFTSEDHLTVHKKRHDMTLSLGLGPKANTFADQTPTPTQFFRNCEAVGLFQDLQNVNPFEETFKKAMEAVKAGQPISVNKSLNPSDESLHTPNVFPHITDVPNVNSPENCLRPENIPPCEDNLLKQDIMEPAKTYIADVEPETQSKTPLEPIDNLTKSTNCRGDLTEEKKIVLNVPKGHLVQLITPDIPQSSCNMVVIKNTVDDFYPFTVREKLKKSLSEKKTGKCYQQKIPILKWPPKRNFNSLSQKFSKFSKNALKLISKLENAEANIGENSSRRSRKGEKYQSKESRSEFLARSRAASFRCREKKKMYVLYLEKKNCELTAAYQNLQFINSLLRKEVCELHNELLKHKNCSAADKATEVTLSVVKSLIEDKTFLEEQEVQISTQQNTNKIPVLFGTETASYSSDALPDLLPNFIDPSSFSFDVAEVTLDDDTKDNEIPMNETHKPPDIIVRFNSVGNDFPGKIPPDSYLDRYIEGAGENVKQIFSEHSYYFKQPTEMYKRMVSTLIPPISSEESKKLEELRMKKSDAFRDITSLNTKVLLEPRTPPPLLLLKPFKKRSLQNKQSEKT